MRVNDIITEADNSSDYQQMQQFIKANHIPGIPRDQQIPLALFKELQKQKDQNQQLSAELDAAEQRIDQATQSGKLQGKELGMHRTELDRERRAGDQQRAAVDQLGQQYTERSKASAEQIADLSQQLEAVKSMPGVSQEAAKKLETQIKQLSDTGINADQLKELENRIAVIQSAESTDDAAIKDLVKKVNDAQAATAELAKTKQTVGNDAEETAERALDQIEQIKQQLAHFREVEAQTTLLAQQLNKVSQRQQIADKLQQANYAPDTASMARDQIATQGASAMVPPGEPSTQMSLPGVDTPAPVSGSQIELPGVDQPQTEPDRAQALKGRIKQQLTPTTVNNVYESAFKRSVAWATGKTK